MLTQKDFDLILKEANKLYSGFELELISEIAERIANVGYANTVVYNDVAIAQEMGMMYQDVVNLVAKYNNTASDEIVRIFNEAGISSIKLDDKIYKKAGLSPRGLSSSMTQLLTATAKKTSNKLTNLCMTTAETSQTQFYNAINKAYLETSTGVKSYSTAIIDAIKDVSQQGAYVSYGTRKMSLEASTRMNILTGVNQTSGKLQLMRAEEMGWDLMEISAHGGARPEHAEWQGKIVSRSGKKGYLSLDDIGYGEATGFQGVNCRHTWFPYYEGSTLTYTNKELEELKNEKVTYNGTKYTKYEASQIQRGMERQIRQDKKEIAGMQGILTSNNKDDKLMEDTRISLANTQMKLKQNNSILNDFVKQTGLKKDTTRLYIGKTSPTVIKKSKDTNVSYKWKNLKTLDEAKEYVYTKYIDSDIDNIKNIESLNTTLKKLNELQKQYPLKENIFIRNKTLSKAKANGNYEGININTVIFNKANSHAITGIDWENDLDRQIKELEQYLGNLKYKQKPIKNGIEKLEEQKKYKCFSISESYSEQKALEATISHEYGHVIADQYFGQINKQKANKDFDYFDSNECWQKCIDVSKAYNQALKNNDIYNISWYASTDEKEFFAECFAKKQMGEKLPKYLEEMIERVLKIGK